MNLSRHDAETGYVISLLRHDDDKAEDPLLRLYDTDVRIEPSDIGNSTLRALLYFILANARQETSVSIKLAALHLQVDEQWLRERCNAIDPSSTRLYAKVLTGYIEGGKVDSAAESMTDIVSDQTLSPREKLELMQEKLAKVRLESESERVTTISGLNNRWLEALKQRQADIAAGKKRVAFPDPLEDLNDYVPYLYDGDMVLVTAETGVGKSSFGGQFFDGNIKRGFRGIRLRFEDSDEKAGARRALRQMAEVKDLDTEESVGVPAARLMAPKILRDQELDVIRFAHESITDWGEGGIEVFCHGWSMDQALSVVRRYAMSEGVDFVVIDYLNKAQLSSTKLRGYGLFAARGQDAELVKSITEELGIITVLIQQENPTNGMPFETTMSLQKSQVWLSLHRKIDEGGERLEKGAIAVKKANMGRTGTLSARFDTRWLIWEPR